MLRAAAAAVRRGARTQRGGAAGDDPERIVAAAGGQHGGGGEGEGAREGVHEHESAVRACGAGDGREVHVVQMLLSVLLFSQAPSLGPASVRACQELVDAVDFGNPVLPRETKETLLLLLRSSPVC